MNSMDKNIDDLLKVQTAYDSPPWWYDIRGFFILTLTYNDTLWNQISFFSKNLSNKHLEAAIGTGTLVKMISLWKVWFMRTGPLQGVGFDYSPAMLEGAKKKLSTDTFQVLVADVGNLSYPNNTFESINLANSLHCLPDVDQALVELHRVLKTGHYLYTNVLLYPDQKSFWGRISHSINTWGIRKGILITPYTEEEILNHVTKAGFKIEKKFRAGNSLNMILKKSAT